MECWEESKPIEVNSLAFGNGTELVLGQGDLGLLLGGEFQLLHAV